MKITASDVPPEHKAAYGECMTRLIGEKSAAMRRYVRDYHMKRKYLGMVD